jgi:hypothetical protein
VNLTEKQLLPAVLLLAVLMCEQNVKGADSIAAGTATGAASLGTDDFPGRVGELLQVPDTGADVLPAIENALKRVNGAPAESAGAINALTDAILKGPHPSVLLNVILPRVEIGESTTRPMSQPAWKWGTAANWRRMILTMGKLAVSLQKSDEKRASEIARAALYLSALRDYRDEWDGLKQITSQTVDMKKLLQLPGNNFEDLKALVNKRLELQSCTLKEGLAAAKIFDAFVDGPKDQITQDKIDAVMGHYDKAFRSGSSQLGWKADVITRTWSFLNLMRVKGSSNGQKAVRELFEKWKEDSSDPHVRRWISQALSREGPAAGRQFMQLELGEDGRIRPYKPATASKSATSSKPAVEKKP